MDRKIYTEINCVFYKIFSYDIINRITNILLKKPKPKYNVKNLIKLRTGRIGVIRYPPIWCDWKDCKPQWLYSYNHGFGLEIEDYSLEKDVIYKIC